MVSSAGRPLSRQGRPGVARARDPGQGPGRGWCPSRAGGARQAVVAEADRRVASVRSKITAVVAATRAAPSAIKVICQPAMPPATTGTVAGGSPAPGRDHVDRPGGRDDGRRGQQGAGQGGQGRGGPAQPRGALPGRGGRVRSPEGTVCGHDHLLILGTGRLSRARYRHVRPAGP